MRMPGIPLLLCTLASLTACTSQAGPYPDRLPIGKVQGRVEPEESATNHRSPLNGELVTIRGVVTELLRWRTYNGDPRYGMLVQDLPDESDGDPLSSDGILVYLDKAPTLPMEEGTWRAVPGDLVTLRGKVSERYKQTELSEARVLAVTGHDTFIEPVPLILNAEKEETERILERHEGMLVSLPPGSVAIAPNHVNYHNGDLQIVVTPADNPVLQRPRASERRIFRDPHPLDDIPERLHDNGNGMRLTLGSMGLKGVADSGDAALPLVHTGTRLTNGFTGGILYTYGTYILQVREQPDIDPTVDPSTWRIPVPEDPRGLRIATFNMENLYDFRNDPGDDCDDRDDPGCPGVRKPFDYVPVDEATYRARVDVLARQVVEDLKSPDILMVQEIEDQDILGGPEGTGDGQLDPLQDLVERIVAHGGTAYTVTSDRDGADTRGITCAFLYDPSVFTPVPATPDHPVFGTNPVIQVVGDLFPMTRDVQNPKAFNARYMGQPDDEQGLPSIFSRPLQVLGLQRNGSPGRTLWLINNHFSSRPDHRVERRRQQAGLNVAVANLIRESHPEDGIIIGGDLNVFPRPDDPYDPPSDQLGPLYDAGLSNVWDFVISRDPANAYSYVYDGEANTLDHLFLSPTLSPRIRSATYLHVNSDWPDGYTGKDARRGSDHDPLLLDLDW